MTNKTIKNTLSKYGLIATGFLVLIFIGSFVFQSIVIRMDEIGRIEAELIATSESQAKRIAGSMILPEEQAAIPMILNRIRAQENLSHISVNQGFGETLPVPKHCRQIGRAISEQSYSCSGAFSQEVKVLTVIKSGDDNYGVLEKTRRLNKIIKFDLFSLSRLLPLPLTALMVGALLFAVFRFVRRDLCAPLQKIVESLSEGREARQTMIDRQKYIELKNLADSIYAMQSQLEDKSLKEKLGELSRQMVHDLRSPLSLLKVVTQDSDHSMTEHEKRMARLAVRRVQGIVDSVLNVKSDDQSQQATSNGSPDLTNTNLIIENLKGVLDEKAHLHRGRLVFNFDNLLNENLFLYVDQQSLIQVVENILDNAIQANAGNAGPGNIGSIRLRIFIEGDVARNLVLEILDTGGGIDPNDQVQMGSEGFTTKFDGNGLGVFHARQVLEKCGGSLNFVSEKGIGTLAKISLPLVSGDVGASEIASTPGGNTFNRANSWN